MADDGSAPARAKQGSGGGDMSDISLHSLVYDYNHTRAMAELEAIERARDVFAKALVGQMVRMTVEVDGKESVLEGRFGSHGDSTALWVMASHAAPYGSIVSIEIIGDMPEQPEGAILAIGSWDDRVHVLHFSDGSSMEVDQQMRRDCPAAYGEALAGAVSAEIKNPC